MTKFAPNPPVPPEPARLSTSPFSAWKSHGPAASPKPDFSAGFASTRFVAIPANSKWSRSSSAEPPGHALSPVSHKRARQMAHRRAPRLGHHLHGFQRAHHGGSRSQKKVLFLVQKLAQGLNYQDLAIRIPLATAAGTRKSKST